MRVLLGCLTGLAGLAVVHAAGGQNAISHEHTFHRSTPGGQELSVFTYTRFHRDCRPDTPPQIIVRDAPAHGAVTLRPAATTVTVVREGAADCTGKTYPGIRIVYSPTPGYRGIDTFSWDVVGHPDFSHDSAIVDVK